MQASIALKSGLIAYLQKSVWSSISQVCKYVAYIKFPEAVIHTYLISKTGGEFENAIQGTRGGDLAFSTFDLH